MILRDSPELVWRGAGALAFAAVVVGSLTPDGGPPSSLDLLVHVMAYGLIAALFARGSWTRKEALIWALAVAAGGAAIEVLQAFVGRQPSVSDGIANLVGAILGALVGGRSMLEPTMELRDANEDAAGDNGGEPIIR